jgi:hypothetical protein
VNPICIDQKVVRVEKTSRILIKGKGEFIMFNGIGTRGHNNVTMKRPSNLVTMLFGFLKRKKTSLASVRT